MERLVLTVTKPLERFYFRATAKGGSSMSCRINALSHIDAMAKGQERAREVFGADIWTQRAHEGRPMYCELCTLAAVDSPGFKVWRGMYVMSWKVAV